MVFPLDGILCMNAWTKFLFSTFTPSDMCDPDSYPKSGTVTLDCIKIIFIFYDMPILEVLWPD